MQMAYLYAPDLPFKNFIYSRHLTVSGLVIVNTIWQFYDAIHHQYDDRRIENDVNLLTLQSSVGKKMADVRQLTK